MNLSLAITFKGQLANAFSGPLDNYSNIQAAYSIRKLRSAYTGNALLLRRSSDNAELAFGFLANGDLNTTAIATWLGGGSGFVVTWYDQSGNSRNIVQTTADNQPLYVASGPNSKPTVRFDGTNDRLRVTFSNIAAPHHIFTVAKFVSWVSGRSIFDGGGTYQMAMLEDGSSGQIAMITGVMGPRKTFGTTNYHVGTWYNLNVAAAHYARMDGSQTGTGSTVGSANISGITLGSRGDQTLFGNVEFSEWVLFNAEQSNSPIEANMGAYYGITIP